MLLMHRLRAQGLGLQGTRPHQAVHDMRIGRAFRQGLQIHTKLRAVQGEGAQILALPR